MSCPVASRSRIVRSSILAELSPVLHTQWDEVKEAGMKDYRERVAEMRFLERQFQSVMISNRGNLRW